MWTRILPPTWTTVREFIFQHFSVTFHFSGLPGPVIIIIIQSKLFISNNNDLHCSSAETKDPAERRKIFIISLI